MKHLLLSVSSLICFIGCNPELPNATPASTDAISASITIPVEEKSDEASWRLVDSNEWYDIFELILTDDESLICTAFHKTDAQLGIGIAFNIAILAGDRKFKYFTFSETSLTQNQNRILEPLLPKSLVLESHFLVKYLNFKPEDEDRHVFDAELMARLRRNQPDDFE